MINIKNISIASTLLLAVSCSNQDNKSIENLIDDTVVQLNGEELMKTNCLICHGNGSSHDDILGPPMKGVKHHYLEGGMTEQAFIDAITNWVAEPKQENSRMLGAIEKFKIMPKLEYKTEEVKAIAAYIFNNNMSTPIWFDKHVEEEHSTYSIEGLMLNDGKKWLTDKETSIGFKKMLDLVNVFNENSNHTLSDYNEFGNNMDEIKGDVLSKCTMTGVGHDHLHTLLIPLIRKINGIKEVGDVDKANEIYANIKLNVELYDEFFMF
jgi:cytochrome c2